MKKKILTIGIIGIFLLMGLSAVPAVGKEITIQAFIDENENQEFDKGEKGAEGALIVFYRIKSTSTKIAGLPRFCKADSNGEATFNTFFGNY